MTPDEPLVTITLSLHLIFRLRGVLDPTRAVPGLGASMSEALGVAELTGGAMTQHELGARLGLEKSTVSRLVDGMIRKSWVQRTRDPGKPRYQRVALTPHGRQVADQIATAMRQRHERILATLTPEERHAAAVALPALARALEAELDECSPLSAPLAR